MDELGSRFSHSVPRNHGNSYPSPKSILFFYRLELKILSHGLVQNFVDRGFGITVAPLGISDLGKVTSLYPAWGVGMGP